MRTGEAWPIVAGWAGRRLVELAGDASIFATPSGDKGRAGRYLESVLGLRPGRGEPDFSDGDLKSVAIHADGRVKEQVAVCLVGVDELVRPPLFVDTALHRKTRQIVVAGIERPEPDWRTWRVGRVGFVSALPGTEAFAAIESAYNEIVMNLGQAIDAGVVNGEDFVLGLDEIRTRWLVLKGKDQRTSANVRQASGHLSGVEVADRRLAFYLQKAFVERALAGDWD